MFQYVSKGASDGFDLLPAGVYPAKVIKADEGASKSGNPMITLHLQCTDTATGKRTTVRDYLVMSDNTLWKIDQFMAAIGKAPKEGEIVQILPHLIVGAVCYARLSVDSGDKRDFNRCESLLSVEEGLAQKGGTPTSTPSHESYKDYSKDDDIPF